MKDSVSTDQLLRYLHRRGLPISRTMLAQDVRKGLLPRPQLVSRGRGKGIGRFWQPMAVSRAAYLYRLRRLRLTGALVRVLLYTRDGWGWEDVRPLCVAGLRKITAAESGLVRQRLRRPTPESVEFIVDDIVPDSPFREAALFTWGLGFFGMPIPGGTIGPFLEWLGVADGTEDDDRRIAEAERAMVRFGTTWERMISYVDGLSDDEANQARPEFVTQVRNFRGVIGNLRRRVGYRGPTNILTMFGRERSEVLQVLRHFPGRITPAQLLAAVLGYVMYCRAVASVGEISATDDADRLH